MSIYDNAGVVLIPSGTKASKLYSVLPANGNGDFTHDRNLTTATRVNIDGLIEGVAADVPRLDYPLIDGVVQDCPHLLLEPQRTNNLQRSEEFDNSYWTKTNSTITANQIVSPDGSQNADTLTQSSAGGYLRRDVSFSGLETASCFVKANSVNFVSLFSGGNEVYFDLINGVAATSNGSTVVSYKIDSYGNGWYRCSMTTNYSGSSSVRLYPSQSDGAKSTTTGSVYVYGAQFEAGSYPTSYIPTTSASATRSADACFESGTSADFNSEEGVVFLEIKPIALDGTYKRIVLSDATLTNRIIMGFDNSNNVQATVYNGADQAVMGGNYAGKEDVQKVALKYKVNDFSLYFNGFKVASDSSGSTYPQNTFFELEFRDANSGLPFYGIAKQIWTFKTALTDSELETLTSWDSFNAMAKGQLYTIE